MLKKRAFWDLLGTEKYPLSWEASEVFPVNHWDLNLTSIHCRNSTSQLKGKWTSQNFFHHCCCCCCCLALYRLVYICSFLFIPTALPAQQLLKWWTVGSMVVTKWTWAQRNSGCYIVRPTLPWLFLEVWQTHVRSNFPDLTFLSQ